MTTQHPPELVWCAHLVGILVLNKDLVGNLNLEVFLDGPTDLPINVRIVLELDGIRLEPIMELPIVIYNEPPISQWDIGLRRSPAEQVLKPLDDLHLFPGLSLQSTSLVIDHFLELVGCLSDLFCSGRGLS